MIERGDVLAPRLVGEPYRRQPAARATLVAAGTGIALSPPLPLHDAARVAAALILALTLLLLAATATELDGSKYRWMTVLLFVGSVGLVGARAPAVARARAHARDRRRAVRIRARAAAPRRRRRDAGRGGRHRVPVDGTRRAPSGSLLTALVLPIAFAAWRTRRYATAAAVAAGDRDRCCASPGRSRSTSARRSHLAAWWSPQSLGDFFAPLDPASIGDPAFLVKNLPWFAWPALPLVLWTLVHARPRLQRRARDPGGASCPARSRS